MSPALVIAFYLHAQSRCTWNLTGSDQLGWWWLVTYWSFRVPLSGAILLETYGWAVENDGDQGPDTIEPDICEGQIATDGVKG